MIQRGVLHLSVCHRGTGMNCGFAMRQQVVAAIHAKSVTAKVAVTATPTATATVLSAVAGLA
jgi:hypothetical protein